MTHTTVADIMTTRTATVEPDDRLSEIRHILERAPFHHLLVVQNERLVGVISDRDLLAAISPYAGGPSENARDAATLNRRAHQIMTRDPRTVGADTTLLQARQTLLAGDGGCLPVVDESGHILGIVTWRDLLRAQLPTGSDPAPHS